VAESKSSEGAGFGARVEGLHAVKAASTAGRVRRLWVERARVRDLGELIASVRATGATVEVVDDLSTISQTASPQGLAADCVPRRSQPLTELVRAHQPAALLVSDHIQDPQNLGALARSALASGITGMVVPIRRSAPLSAAAFKAAAGALESMPVALVGSIAESVKQLKKQGLWTVGLAADGDESLFGLALLTEPVALVVGGEQEGIGRLVRERLDVVASIPHDQAVESLNVSVAGALAMYEVLRVRSAETLRRPGSSSAPA
jgi:23S rRNA (guanosine2251-2'-O)-methyltransferase